MATLIPTAIPMVAFFESPLRRFGGFDRGGEDEVAAAASTCDVLDGSCVCELDEDRIDDVGTVDAAVLVEDPLQ
jgi:hypothetical protein